MRVFAAQPRPALACFGLSFALYLAIGQTLAPGRLFGRADLALGTDPPRVIADLTRFDANHYRTKVHPLFVFLLNPPGRLLKELLGAPRASALLLNAGAGALGVALFHVLLGRLGVGEPRAALWTALFALSASQLFFGSVPETYAFSAASLLLLFVLFARGRASGWRFVAAGVLSFGMNLSNLGVAAWLRARAAVQDRAPWPQPPHVLRYTAAVLGLTAALGMLQGLWYPRAKLFFGPDALREEAQYVFLPGDGSALAGRAAELAAHALLFNFAAPRLVVEKAGQRHPVTAFARPTPGALRLPGVAHALVWSALLATGLVWGARGQLQREPAAQALLGALAFQLALHFFYGETLFLYSCHFTFAVLGLVALAAERGLNLRPGWTRRATAVLWTLLALQAADNAAFLRELHAVYR